MPAAWVAGSSVDEAEYTACKGLGVALVVEAHAARAVDN